jgi:hypothetical protein
VPGALDDGVALAEANACSRDSVLFPEARDLVLDRLVLGHERGIVPLRKRVQQLGAALREAIDVQPYLGKGTHARGNVDAAENISFRSLPQVGDLTSDGFIVSTTAGAAAAS